MATSRRRLRRTRSAAARRSCSGSRRVRTRAAFASARSLRHPGQRCRGRVDGVRDSRLRPADRSAPARARADPVSVLPSRNGELAEQANEEVTVGRQPVELGVSRSAALETGRRRPRGSAPRRSPWPASGRSRVRRPCRPRRRSRGATPPAGRGRTLLRGRRTARRAGFGSVRPSRRGKEAGGRVLGVQADLDGVTGDLRLTWRRPTAARRRRSSSCSATRSTP